jgi:hypothetical protein
MKLGLEIDPSWTSLASLHCVLEEGNFAIVLAMVRWMGQGETVFWLMPGLAFRTVAVCTHSARTNDQIVVKLEELRDQKGGKQLRWVGERSIADMGAILRWGESIAFGSFFPSCVLPSWKLP